MIIECVEKEHVIIAVYDGFWRSQGYLLPVDSFAITCQLWVDSGKIERELLADIAFEDEAGIAIMTRSGRPWGDVGSPPNVVVSDQRGGYNVVSIVTATGDLIYAIEEKTIDGKRYIEFLQKIVQGRTPPLLVIADNASYHRSKEVRNFVRAHRQKIRMFFLPTPSPKLNPDEQVWNEIKHRQLGKQPIKSKSDLNRRIHSALDFLQQQVKKVQSFFQLPDTRYAALQEHPITHNSLTN